MKETWEAFKARMPDDTSGELLQAFYDGYSNAYNSGYRDGISWKNREYRRILGVMPFRARLMRFILRVEEGALVPKPWLYLLFPVQQARPQAQLPDHRKA